MPYMDLMAKDVTKSFVKNKNCLIGTLHAEAC